MYAKRRGPSGSDPPGPQVLVRDMTQSTATPAGAMPGKSGRSCSPSVRAMTAEHVRSPVTFTDVRIMSRILSTPRISAMPACTCSPIPTEFSTMISVMMPAEGTPAAPTEASVAVSTMTICSANPKSIPYI